MRITRRGVQLALGALWLLDATLQCQPYMFTSAFARDVIAPSAIGQPWVVAAPVGWAAQLISAHPVACNAGFAAAQLALALGLLLSRTARVALLASVAWSLAVWWLGEGLGGLLSGHGMLLTGSPGAVVLYAGLALAAYSPGDGRGEPPSGAGAVAWVLTWAAGGVLQALPGQNRPGDVAAALREAADGVPDWLARPTRYLAATVDHHVVVVVALTVLSLLIALAATVPGPPRLASALSGATLAAGFWAFGQGFGLVFSGKSTDPNSGPLLLLLALATAGARRHSPVDRSPSERVGLGPVSRAASGS